LAPVETSAQPTPSEAPSTKGVAPAVPVANVQVPATAHDLEPKHVSPSESEQITAPEPVQAVASPAPELAVNTQEPEQAAGPIKTDVSAASEPGQGTAPTASELDASTHAPVTFSSKPYKTSFENGASANGAAVPFAPSTSGSAAVEGKAETSTGQMSATELPAAPSPTLTKGKHTFPGSKKNEADGISSKTGTSSMRKKRHSIFGGASSGDSGDASTHGSTPRKKTRSFFGKVKHMFDKKD